MRAPDELKTREAVAHPDTGLGTDPDTDPHTDSHTGGTDTGLGAVGPDTHTDPDADTKCQFLTSQQKEQTCQVSPGENHSTPPPPRHPHSLIPNILAVLALVFVFVSIHANRSEN